MKQLKYFNADLKAMFSSTQTPASQKPSMDPRRVWIAVLFMAAMLIAGAVFGFLSTRKSSEGDEAANAADPSQAVQNSEQGGSQVIPFKDGITGAGPKRSNTRATSGTLVRVRLLNSLETFDTVPAFAQIVDYALGQSFYGWTIVGDASGDGNVERVKMGFRLVRSPQGNSSFELGGQALSLDGTLGVRAEKIEGIASRTIIGSGKSAGNGIANSFKGSGDLSSLLMRALLTGLETEVSSDLGAVYNRSVVLSLKPGQEFFVQLTENF